MRLITFISAGAFILFSAFIMKKENQAQTPSSLYETKWSLKKMHTDSGIEEVNTKALVDVVGKFTPKIVKMDGAKHRSWKKDKREEVGE